jgi:hypothetical protein
VNRYQSWKAKQKPSKNNSPSKTLSRQAGNYDASTVVGNGTVRSEWNFDDTIRGTIAGMPIELDLGALDDEEEEWDLENEEVEVWDGTTRIRSGSVIGGDLNTLNVSSHLSAIERKLMKGFCNVSTNAGRLRSAYSFSQFLTSDTFRKCRVGITYSQPSIWEINVARKTKHERNNHERRRHR